MTTVVNIKLQDCDIYIGRPSKWGNPFKVGPRYTREEAILQYEAYIHRRKDLLLVIGELKDKRLGCYCKPLACHGDVLVRLVEDEGNNRWI